MIQLSLGEIAAVTGGRLHGARGDEQVTGSVEFDSRRIGVGGLFVALPGARVDGHDFVPAVMDAGAAGVLAGREVPGGHGAGRNAAVPSVIAPPVEAGYGGSYVLESDHDGAGAAVLAALARLARYVVDTLDALEHPRGRGLTVVGMTGSSGKTSTKDLTAHVLEAAGETVAPPESFNNELGHPWTALRAGPFTRHLVLELSARGPGHVAALCRIAPPRIGAVLNVGSAHLGEFGSREGIAAAKGELVEALPKAADGGVAILGADDPLVAAMADRTAARVVHAGRAPEAHVRAVDVTLDEGGRPSFRLVTRAGEVAVSLALRGTHQVDNALVAAAIALESGLDIDTVAERLGTAEPRSRWRMEVVERPDGVRVVNDAYNANPESMRAALATLGAMATDGRRTAVLGAMGELGDDAADAHAELGREVARTGVERLIVVDTPDGGAGSARSMHEAALAAGLRSELVPDVETATDLAAASVAPGDVVLVKASRAAGLERVAQALAAAVPGAGGAE